MSHYRLNDWINSCYFLCCCWLLLLRKSEAVQLWFFDSSGTNHTSWTHQGRKRWLFPLWVCIQMSTFCTYLYLNLLLVNWPSYEHSSLTFDGLGMYIVGISKPHLLRPGRRHSSWTICIITLCRRKEAQGIYCNLNFLDGKKAKY